MSSSVTVRTARRRTLRIAAAALIAAAGLSLTACSGSDASATKPAASTGSSDASSSAGAQGSDARAGSAAKVDAKAGAAGKGASPVRTQTLADGSKAEIYKLGAQRYRAKIVSRGSVLATLETKGHDAGLDANDMFVVLTLDGQVQSWMGGGHQGPGTFKLPTGWKVKVTKIGELRYRAEIFGFEGKVDTLEANQHDVGLNANGSYIVLSAGGVISGHA